MEFKINWTKTATHKTTLRNFVKAFNQYDSDKSSSIHLEQFEKVLNSLGFFLKKWELQVYVKKYGDSDLKVLNWCDFIDGLRFYFIIR